MDNIIESFNEFLNESSWDKGAILTYKSSMFKKEQPVKTSRDISIALDDAGIKNTWSAKTGEVFITNKNELSKAQKAIKDLDIEYIDEAAKESEDNADDVKLFWACQVEVMGTKIYMSIYHDGYVSDKAKDELTDRIKSKLVRNFNPPTWANSGSKIGEFQLNSLEELIKFRDAFAKFTKKNNS